MSTAFRAARLYNSKPTWIELNARYPSNNAFSEATPHSNVHSQT